MSYQPILLAMVVVALASCQSLKPAPAVGGGQQQPGINGDPNRSVTVSVFIPPLSAIKTTKGDVTKLITNYQIKLISKSTDCQMYGVDQVRPYGAGGVQGFPIAARCSFDLMVGIGQLGYSAGNAFQSMFETSYPVSVSPALWPQGQTAVGLDLMLVKTVYGQTQGFEANQLDVRFPQGQVSGGGGIGGGGIGSVQKISYFDGMKAIIDAKCATCHNPQGSRRVSDLSSYQAFRKFADASVTMIEAGTMPKAEAGGPLSAPDKALFKQWKDLGYPENAAGVPPQVGTGIGYPTPTPTPSTSPTNPPPNGNIVEFRIKAGTGNGPWNDAATTIRLKVGQTLRIINDDSVVHQLHTNGAPCGHGNAIRPGGTGECRAQQPYNGQPLYDHGTNGQVFIQVDR